jgi:type II secretory pathway pseudopilin PulG
MNTRLPTAALRRLTPGAPPNRTVRRVRANQAGLTLIETAIVLSVLMTITSIIAPAGMTVIEQARELRVQQDCSALRDAMIKLMVDSNRVVLRQPQDRGALVDLLVSAGPVPVATIAGDARWAQTPDASGRVDLIENYLMENMPAGNPANAWPAPRSLESGGWRGSYLHFAPAADPWGHRYAINVRYFHTRFDVVVLSAGPNGEVETPFEGLGLRPAGDDRFVLVR